MGEPETSFAAGGVIVSLALTADFVTYSLGSQVFSRPKRQFGGETKTVQATITRFDTSLVNAHPIGSSGKSVWSVTMPEVVDLLSNDLTISTLTFSPSRVFIFGSLKGAAPALHAFPPVTGDLAAVMPLSMATDETTLFYSDVGGSILSVPLGGGTPVALAPSEPVPVDRLELAGDFLFFRTGVDLRRLDVATGCVDVIFVGAVQSFSITGNHVYAASVDDIVDIEISNR